MKKIVLTPEVGGVMSNNNQAIREISLHPEIAQRIDSASERLLSKFSALSLSDLPVSEYTRNYLGGIIRNFGTQLAKYCFILKYMMVNTPSERFHHMKVLDYGGGTGILSLLAAECGMVNVFYNDIYDVSCNDARSIAAALGLSRKGYICGDLSDVIDYCVENNALFDAVGSYDVIEHIYDIRHFLSNLERITADGSNVFMCSGANPYNDGIYRKLVETHFKCEYFDREVVYGWKERDSLASYAKIRREFISHYAAERGLQLPADDLDTLTCCTRGMMKHDIGKAMETFIAQKLYPKPDMRYPTNTCDPNTGNWAEHLMDFDALVKVMRCHFAYCDVVPDSTQLPASPYISLFAINKRGGSISFSS